MDHANILDKNEFWKLLLHICSLDEKTTLDSICEELDIAPDKVCSVLNMLGNMDVHIEKEIEDGEIKSLGPASNMPNIKFEMPLPIWLQFQAHFPLFSKADNKPYHKDVNSFLSKVESNNSQFDLFEQLQVTACSWSEENPLDLFASQLSSKELLNFIDETTLEGKSLTVTHNDQTVNVFPWMVIHIEGKLSLVGELHSEKCLMYLPIDEMSAAHELDEEWVPNFSKMEVEDFVKGIRDIAGDEIRLILKLKSLEQFNTEGIENNVNRPVMVVNLRGEHIWGGSLEKNDEVFEWLASLENSAEILEPESFKKEFLAYCEALLKKSA